MPTRAFAVSVLIFLSLTVILAHSRIARVAGDDPPSICKWQLEFDRNVCDFWWNGRHGVGTDVDCPGYCHLAGAGCPRKKLDYNRTTAPMPKRVKPGTGMKRVEPRVFICMKEWACTSDLE